MGPNRGIGVANLFHATGYLSSSATIRVNEDATITIISGVTEVGPGSQTVLRRSLLRFSGWLSNAVRIAVVDSDSAAICNNRLHCQPETCFMMRAMPFALQCTEDSPEEMVVIIAASLA